MHRTLRALLALALLATLLAGCGAPSPPPFPDADDVWEERTGRGQARFEGTHTVQVPNNTTELRLALLYDLERDTTLTASVHSATGAEVHSLQNFGPFQEEDDRWLTVRDPVPGEWTLRARMEGRGHFAFGTYLTPTPDADPEG